MTNKRFTKGQEIYRICSVDKEITKVIVKSCGLKKLTLISDSYHGHISPNEISDGFLTYHSTLEEAQNELNK
jgi:hypothetical protein